MSRQQGQPTETPEAVTMETVLDFLPEPEDFLEAADIFQQLGDSSRLRIFWLLCHCEACGVEIAAAVEMSSAAVAHHLKTLRLGRLVQSRRVGKEVYYSLADTEMARHVHRVVDDFFRMTCPGRVQAHPCALHTQEGDGPEKP